jgi:hypothetical protein
MEYRTRSNAGSAQPEIEEEKSLKHQAASLKKATIKNRISF